VTKPLDSQVGRHVVHAPGLLPKFPKLVPAAPTSQEQRRVAPPVAITIPKFLPTLPFDYLVLPPSNQNVKMFRFDPNASPSCSNDPNACSNALECKNV
jgi:hypothetical protein